MVYMWTRGGRRVELPAWFQEQLPMGFRLDGEGWLGRSVENDLEGLAASMVTNGAIARRFRFMVFDAPEVIGPWDVRMTRATARIGSKANIRLARFARVHNFDDLCTRFFKVYGAGGEGLVLRNPAITHYEIGRTKNALRLKHDPEWR